MMILVRYSGIPELDAGLDASAFIKGPPSEQHATKLMMHITCLIC